MTRTRWMRQGERGSAVLLRLALFLCLHLGWSFARLLLLPITGWFLLTSQPARAASRAYLCRALGRPATAWEVCRHFHQFSHAILDRVFLLADRAERFEIEITGIDHLRAMLAAERGCLLLGAHLGSFEVLRAIARQAPVPVKALMFRDNIGALTRTLERLEGSPHGTLPSYIIEMGTPAAMLRAQECLARGEILGILADRLAGTRHVVEVEFLGARAGFPAGPVLLAAALGVPSLLFYAIRTGPRRYAVRFEPFAERIVLRRAQRLADAGPWVARYAARLETMCRAHPFDWFNFYPFWEPAADEQTPGMSRDRAAAGTPPNAGG